MPANPAQLIEVTLGESLLSSGRPYVLQVLPNVV